MNIDALTKMEEDLLAKMPQGGHFNDREKFLDENGIYKKWQKIFEHYSQLALEGNIEALKRAVFFLWYQTCEPAPLSGLKDLNVQAVASTLEHLNKLITSEQIDSELAYMLPYYYQIAEWYIPKEVEADAILSASQISSGENSAGLNKSNFVNRGQLGQYWQSLQS
ncbi:hypothetical protein NBRC116493_02830 [Aurantivibrio infirmus]